MCFHPMVSYCAAAYSARVQYAKTLAPHACIGKSWGVTSDFLDGG